MSANLVAVGCALSQKCQHKVAKMLFVAPLEAICTSQIAVFPFYELALYIFEIKEIDWWNLGL